MFPQQKIPLVLFYPTPPLTKFILALLLHTWNGTLKPFSSAFSHDQMTNIALSRTVSPRNSLLLKMYLFLWRQIHHVTAEPYISLYYIVYIWLDNFFKNFKYLIKVELFYLKKIIFNKTVQKIKIWTLKVNLTNYW